MPANEWLFKSIIRTLDSLKASIDQHTETIREQREAASQTGEPQPPPIIRSEIQLPPAVSGYYETEQRERPSKTRWEWIKRGIELIAFVAAIALAVLTYKTLKQVQRQADSAQGQLEAMREQNRPWIKITDVKTRDRDRPPILDLSFQHPGRHAEGTQATLQIEILMKNVGHSVAANTTADWELFIPLWRNGYALDIIQEEQRFCENSLIKKTDPLTPRVILFPDEPFEWFGGAAGLITPETTNQHTRGHPFFLAVLIGCVKYQFTSLPTTYQTRFLYELLHSDGDRSRFFEVDRDISGQHLMLIRNQQGDYAK